MSLFGKTGPTPEETAKENKVKGNITDTLKLAIKDLQRTHISSEAPIRSEDHANAVCNVLEAIFLHGLKSWPTNKCFWSVLTKVTHRDVISQLNHLGQITTEIGMCRAWIRLALNDGIMESYLEALIGDKSTLKHYYKVLAYLRDEEHRDILKSYIQSLCYFTFELSYNSSVLNLWTSSPLVLAGLARGQQDFPRPVVQSANTGPAVSTSPVVPPPASEGRSAAATGHRVPASGSHTQGLSGSLNQPDPPPNTPYGATQLSSTDIEQIRQLSAHALGSDTASTDTSQVSQPDFNDARDLLMPAILHDLEEMKFQAIIADTAPIRREETPSPEIPTHTEVSKMKGKGKSKGGKHGGKRGSSHAASDTSSVEESTVKQGAHLHRPVAEPEIIPQPDATPILDVVPNTDASPKPSSIHQLEPESAAHDNKHIEGEVKQDTERGTKIKDLFPGLPTSPVKSTTESASGETRTEGSEGTPAAALGSRRNSSFSELFPPKKSPPLQPELSTAVASTGKVEIADEAMTSDPTDPPLLPVQHIGEEGEGGGEDGEGEADVQAVGNSLGLLQGWSSAFEPDILPDVTLDKELTEEDRQRLLSTADDSFGHLLHSYQPSTRPMDKASMSDVLESLAEGDKSTPQPQQPANRPKKPTRKLPTEGSMESEGFDEYEVLPDLVPGDKSYLSDPKFVPLLEIIGDLCNEQGLDMQNYQCKTCARPVGMFYGKARVCTYDGSYYCYECHENEEYYIPSRIVYNWDFRKHQVSKRNFEFLRMVEEEPLLNIQKLNPSLYQHVPELGQINQLRLQLRFLRTYLFSCKQSVADDLRRQVWPKEYLFDDIHAYSLNDLLQVGSGQLATSVQKVIKFATKHVYSCRLCSLKGFICEICKNSKVIYPFQMDTTTRCEKCKSVYHKDCKTELKPCPKCERRRSRLSTSANPSPTTPDAADYTYPQPHL